MNKKAVGKEKGKDQKTPNRSNNHPHKLSEIIKKFMALDQHLEKDVR